MEKSSKRTLLQRVMDVYAKIESYFIVLFTLTLGALIIIEVVLRALGHQGFSWIEELSRYMLIITTIIGCSLAVRDDGHPVMDTLYQFLPKRGAHLVRAVAYLISGALYCFLGYQAAKWTMTVYALKKTWEVSASMPLYPIWIFFSFGLCTMGLRYFVQVKNAIVRFARHEAYESVDAEAEDLEKIFVKNEEEPGQSPDSYEQE